MEELFVTKFGKILAAIAVLVIGAFTLVSCGSYNFYSDWKNAGADIEKENIYEAITLDNAKQKLDNDETFVLLLGTSEASGAARTITNLQSQADYFGFDKKLYFVDSTNYLSKTADRKNLNQTLGIYDASQISNNIVIVCYNSGDIIMDTSKKTTDSSLENFVTDSSIDYYKIASYLFNDFIFE